MISRGHRKRKISLTRNKLTHKCLHLLFNTDSSLFLRSYLKNLSRHLCGFYQAFGYHTFCRFECFRYLLTKKKTSKKPSLCHFEEQMTLVIKYPACGCLVFALFNQYRPISRRKSGSVLFSHGNYLLSRTTYIRRYNWVASTILKRVSWRWHHITYRVVSISCRLRKKGFTHLIHRAWKLPLGIINNIRAS